MIDKFPYPQKRISILRSGKYGHGNKYHLITTISLVALTVLDELAWSIIQNKFELTQKSVLEIFYSFMLKMF